MCIRIGRLSVRCARLPLLTPAAPLGDPVLAAYRTPAGRWSIVAPACRDLSGRMGVRRIAVLDEPTPGGAEVIKLRDRVGSDRRA